jgi:hypothetical protein
MKVCANSVNNEFHTQAAVSPSICFVIKWDETFQSREREREQRLAF